MLVIGVLWNKAVSIFMAHAVAEISIGEKYGEYKMIYRLVIWQHDYTEYGILLGKYHLVVVDRIFIFQYIYV